MYGCIQSRTLKTAVILWDVVFGLLYAFGMLVSSDDTVGVFCLAM